MIGFDSVNQFSQRNIEFITRNLLDKTSFIKTFIKGFFPLVCSFCWKDGVWACIRSCFLRCLEKLRHHRKLFQNCYALEIISGIFSFKVGSCLLKI